MHVHCSSAKGGRVRIKRGYRVTRPDKKALERAALDSMLKALGVRPESIEDGEKPDFMLSIAGHFIGVELTTFQSNIAMDGKLGLRQVEAEWEAFEKAIPEFRAARPELKEINVGLMFKGAGPPRVEHQVFMEEVGIFGLSQKTKLTEIDVAFWPSSFSSPLMTKYLRTVFMRRSNHALWYSNISAGSIGLPDTVLTDIVQQKAGLSYRAADELWLAIQSTPRISELLIPLNGVADFESIPGLAGQLAASPFSRVFVFGPGGLFQWSKATGWTT